MYYRPDYIIHRVKQLADFTHIPEDYWVVGIRSWADRPDEFDDMFYLFQGEDLILTTTGTTNPGESILKGGWKRYQKHGAAVLESDRIYYDVWEPGKHKGYMPALLQTGAKVTVFRDGDSDSKSEEQGKKESGYFGINFHTATKAFLDNIEKEKIGGWSAGCQVANRTEDYMKIIRTIADQPRVTYALLKEFSI